MREIPIIQELISQLCMGFPGILKEMLPNNVFFNIYWAHLCILLCLKKTPTKHKPTLY